jgi:glycosyltransferase involved in cell wall biosynthesis
MSPTPWGPTVLLTTEGTYPYHRGGVSTWCHALTHRLSDVEFTLLAVTMHPYLTPQYELASNVREVITVPLWGTEDPAEYGRHLSFPEYLRCRWATTKDDVEDGYLQPYERLLREVVNPQLPPRSLGLTLLQLHQLFRRCDYQRLQMHPAVWDTFSFIARGAWREQFPNEPAPSLSDLTEAWRLLYRLLLPLSVDVPRTALTHSAAAAFCGLPCIMSKLLWETPYLLTEHGVYLREQYLNLGRTAKSLFVRWFMFRLMSTIVDVNYAFADQVSPVCQYNTRWERWRDIEPSRIRVIYNGVDPVTFSPPVSREPNARPTVVSVGLIFPLKGQIDLIDAAALVRQSVPDVEFRIYGNASDEQYYRDCQDRVRTLGLERHVVFAGSTNEAWAVLRAADVVALPSISEAFPYAVVEAMMTGSAIVATDVGGVREALGSAGLLVHPHDPTMLAEGIATLLRWPEGRARLGLEARDRALRWFTEQRFVEGYRASYARLAARWPALVEATDAELEAPEELAPVVPLRQLA